MSEHTQVGPYALGLLDPLEMSRFEEHLAECDECGAQLEWMLPVADQLADVEPGDLFGIDGPSAFSAPGGSIPPSMTMTDPSTRPSSQAQPTGQPPPYAPLRELQTPQYPEELAPTAGPAGPRTGEFPGADPRTSEMPNVDPRTGGIPRIDPRTGGIPRIDPRTGSMPTVDPRTGSIPTVDPRTGTGSLPTVDPRTGSVPRVDPRTGGISRVDPRTGGISRVDPPSGSVPRVDPRTGELPRVDPLTGENRIVPLVRGGDSRRRTQSQPPAQSQPVSRRAVEPEYPSRRPMEPQYPTRGRRVFMLAAAAAVLGAVAGAGAVVSGPWANQATTTEASSETEGLLDNAQQIAATDAETGVHAAVKLASKPWGTLVGFTVTEVDGPRNCRLVAVLADGKTEVLSTWIVPEQGYGEGTEPPELELMAATALNARDISSLRVQDVTDDGKATTLVTVRA